MKKTIFLALTIVAAVAGQAQIEERPAADWKTIGQLKFGGITRARIEYTNSGDDTTYFLFIKDVRERPESNYFGITFKGINGTYEKLYTILKSFFLSENKKDKQYSRTFNLGKSAVNVQHHRLITSRGIKLSTTEGYTYLSEKDIDKLFGKD